MERVYIGLGSNLDNPLEQVQSAIAELAALPDSTLLAQSPWYGSAAVGPGEQPDYVNGVVCLNTSLEAHALLDNLQAIEHSHMRVRQEHWGPRTLDLDLLLFGQQVIDTERLQVPHPWLQQRNFVVLPLADVAPELTLPGGTSLQVLAQAISREGIWRLDDLRPHLNR
jgi:2-amino-4-hydroxy-6-hydroxymethyldihydropteridine diphosphokinase